ncbi:hypothetical protein FRC12_016580 [Ceratobasidium sp. 428]|nr:hypothetical protein FRC12_016580 [Ceratobasidium sp. 428]
MSAPSIDVAQPKLIYTANLNELSHAGTPVDIRSTATIERYRFVECAPLVKDGTLRIHEYTKLPKLYTAVSYVWRGNKPLPDDKSPTFTVQGSEEYDPISIQVVQDACRAATQRNTDLLWLDRLSIIQSNEDDSAWQLTNMYDIYRFSDLCVVIPGGLSRLTDLGEVTPWIHRGWTLQEAVAPPNVEVLFLWDRGRFKARPSYDSSGFTAYITEVAKGRCAMAPLWLILEASVSGTIYLVDEDVVRVLGQYSGVSIFGVGPKGYTPNDFRFVMPNIAMLAAVVSRSMQEDHDRRHYCLWKCVLMRSTRDPADMIFSAMGMFGVRLDPKKFNVNDRVRPTIALAQEILKKGGRANWLGISFHSPPCPQLSTFPTFPKTSQGGEDQKALIRTPTGYVEIFRLMDNEYPISAFFSSMPTGEMDTDGYLTFSAKSMPVTLLPASNAPTWDRQKSWWILGHIKTTCGDIWQTISSPPEVATFDSSSKAFAVLLGCFFSYHPTQTLAYDCDNIRGFIIKQHAPGKFHIDSYFMLTIKATDWVKGWQEHQFCIGGPDKLETVYADEPLTEVDPTDIIDMPIPDKATTFASIDSVHVAELAKAASLNRN